MCRVGLSCQPNCYHGPAFSCALLQRITTTGLLTLDFPSQEDEEDHGTLNGATPNHIHAIVLGVYVCVCMCVCVGGRVELMGWEGEVMGSNYMTMGEGWSVLG